jgi:hypothetical protein
MEWSMGPEEAAPILDAARGDTVIVAAAAVRAVVESFDFDATVFEGCTQPGQGLLVTVYPPSPGNRTPILYTVVVAQRFEECGGPGDFRVLDWHEVYAVTGDGKVRGKARPTSAR